MMLASSAYCATAQQTELGNAKIMERIFVADFDACEKTFKDFLCQVVQYEGTDADLGIKLQANNPRCSYTSGESEIIVSIDLTQRGYLTVVQAFGGLRVRGVKAKEYIKKCFSSLKDDDLKLLVVSFPK